MTDCADVWDLEAFYIAQAITSYIMILSPEKIVLGGGVMHQELLFPLICKKVVEMVNGYIQASLLEDMENYIVPSSLHDEQGILGGLVLARNALKEEQ